MGCEPSPHELQGGRAEIWTPDGIGMFIFCIPWFACFVLVVAPRGRVLRSEPVQLVLPPLIFAFELGKPLFPASFINRVLHAVYRVFCVVVRPASHDPVRKLHRRSRPYGYVVWPGRCPRGHDFETRFSSFPRIVFEFRSMDKHSKQMFAPDAPRYRVFVSATRTISKEVLSL